MDFDFDCGFNTDFMGDEDFGLARSFSNQPLCQIAPLRNFGNTAQQESEKEVEQNDVSEIRADGFCFKLAPTED